MKDELKKYLNDNRSEFESDGPSENLWAKIDQDLRPAEKNKFSFGAWKVAASVAILLGLGYLFLNNPNPGNSDPELVENNEREGVNVMSDISKDLEEVETYYSMQVNDKMSQLQDYEIDEELVSEVDELKKEFEELKKEMGVGADQSIVVEAMINNYRLRLMLLEDLLMAVGDNKKTNTKNYERDI